MNGPAKPEQSELGPPPEGQALLRWTLLALAAMGALLLWTWASAPNAGQIVPF